MEINCKKGIGTLLFGMRRNDVEAILGKPDHMYADEDKNKIWLYNAHRLALTFYEDEDFRFGYLVTANPEHTVHGFRLIGLGAADAISKLPQKQFRSWESQWEEGVQNHFNEDNWLLLTEEFGAVIKVELGAAIERDEFVWAVR